jgi:hypothetical protein
LLVGRPIRCRNALLVQVASPIKLVSAGNSVGRICICPTLGASLPQSVTPGFPGQLRDHSQLFATEFQFELLRILAVALNRGFDLWEFLIRAQDPLNRRGSSSHMRMTNSTCSSGNPDSPAIPASRMIRRRPYAGRLTAPSRRDDRRVTGGSPAGHRKMREVGAAAVSRARGRRGKRGEPKAGES